MNGMRWRFPLFGLAAVVAMARAVRADECVVRGKHVVLESVVVRSGDLPVVVDLAGTSAQARISVGRGAPHTVEVADAITFKGTRRNIWYTLARPLIVAHGMVELDAGAKVVNARARGARVAASVAMSADDVLPGEDKAPDEIIQLVDLPCAALTLDEPGTDDRDDGQAEGVDNSAGGDGTWWRQRRSARYVVLRAAPRSNSATIVLTTSIEDSAFSFERVAEHGAWMRVARKSSGVRVIGWMQRRDLVSAEEPMSQGGCSGDHGPGLSGRGWSGGQPVTVYKGPARLRVGAKLDLHGSPWATVANRDGFEVWLYEFGGRRVAEVSGIPGLSLRDPSYPTIDPSDVSPTPEPPQR